MPLIPETAPSNPRSSHAGKAHPGASPHEFATFQTEKDIRGRIRLREAETRVLNDPAIQAEWAAAHRATTEPEHRARLTVYYDHLYDRVIKLDPSVAVRAKVRKANAIARMKYTRLGDADNSENPFVAPAPSASGPNPPPPADSSQ